MAALLRYSPERYAADFPQADAMNAFVARHAERIIGALSGFDRLVFRGTVRQLAHGAGVDSFLGYRRIRLKDVSAYAQRLTHQIREKTEQIAAAHERPVLYLESSQISKEDTARAILQQQPVTEGLICSLSCVEPCRSVQVGPEPDSKRLEVHPRLRTCLHYYHDYLHRRFGCMHVRLQTWFPFTVQVGLNGREWRCRRLDAGTVPYERRDNTLAWGADFARAQGWLGEQVKTNWPRALRQLRRGGHPLHGTFFPEPNMQYYWSVFEMEWASDLAFDRPAALAALYRPLTHQAITHFGAGDVMRFLGRKINGHFKGEVISDFKNRPEGIRVKHGGNRNSVKVYDKQASVLRVETTINQPRDLKAFRRPEGNPKGKRRWRPVRKGVADIGRLAQIAQATNDRYYAALASLQDRTPLHKVVDKICRRTSLKGRRVRALQPWSEPDASLLRAVNRGEFVLSGFRNRDIRAQLYPSAATPEQRKRAAAKVGRLLRILRAHRIIKKVATSNRYQVTKRGRLILTAILAARDANITDLVKEAA